MKKEKNDFGRFLESNFISWQSHLGRRVTLAEYADYLEIDRAQLSQYLNGHVLPKKEIADRLAKKLGYEIYDLLNLERPDPLVDQFIESINDPSERKVLQEFMEYVHGLDDEGREEIYRRLQSRSKEALGFNVIPEPKTK